MARLVEQVVVVEVDEDLVVLLFEVAHRRCGYDRLGHHRDDFGARIDPEVDGQPVAALVGRRKGLPVEVAQRQQTPSVGLSTAKISTRYTSSTRVWAKRATISFSLGASLGPKKPRDHHHVVGRPQQHVVARASDRECPRAEWETAGSRRSGRSNRGERRSIPSPRPNPTARRCSAECRSAGRRPAIAALPAAPRNILRCAILLS